MLPISPLVLSKVRRHLMGSIYNNNNAGRGLGNFQAALANGSSQLPLNAPAAASTQVPTSPQPPSLNQVLTTMGAARSAPPGASAGALSAVLSHP